MNNGSILQKLIANRVLTPHSVAALKVALDGWHDTTIADFAGIPGTEVGKLFTFDDVSEIEISKTTSPVALPAGAWACRIGMNPFAARVLMKSGASQGSTSFYDNSVSAGLNGNVLISYAQDGTDFPTYGVGGVSEQTQILQMSDDFLTGKLKLCGCAIEVINTTPELTVGGLVTACNVPQPDSDSRYNSSILITAGVDTGTQFQMPLRMVNGFPKNLKEMAKYSPFQNKAKDGVYINARLQFKDKTQNCSPIGPIIFDIEPVSSPAVPAIPCLLPVYSTSTSGGISVRGFGNFINWFDTDSPVIMFTGLSDTTTLMVRVRWFGQIVPDEDTVVFLRAAKPAPVYDPNFFEIYARAIQTMPHACAFTENPSGEWWKMALGSIARAAAPLLMMVPHPIAKAAGVALGGAGAFLDSAETESRVKRRKKNASGAYDKNGQMVRKNAYGEKTYVNTGKPVKKTKKSIPNAPPVNTQKARRVKGG